MKILKSKFFTLVFSFVFLLSLISCRPEIANGQQDLCEYYKYINVLMEVYCSKSKITNRNAPDTNSVRFFLQRIETELRRDPAIDEIANEIKKKHR